MSNSQMSFGWFFSGEGCVMATIGHGVNYEIQLHKNIIHGS